MCLLGSNTDSSTLVALLRRASCVVCVFFLSIAGCQPAPETAQIPATQDEPARLSEYLRTPTPAPKQVETVNALSAGLAGPFGLAEPTVTAQTEDTVAGFDASESSPTSDPGAFAGLPSQTRVHSLGEVSLKEKPSSAVTEPRTPSRSINLPALTDPNMADELISVNFDQVDIRVMLKTIGDITGINFVVDDAVRGTVTVMSPTQIRLGDVYRFMESILEVNGCAAVPGPDLVKIVPRAEATSRNLRVQVGSDPEQIPVSDTLVTQIIPLRYAKATDVSQIIRSSLAPGAHMATYPRTNSILITDTSSNIRHIAEVIQQLDVPGSKEQVTVIALEHASAEVLSEQIAGIMKQNRPALSRGSGTQGMNQVDSSIKIMADLRTNSLIAVATTQDTEVIVKLARQLDIQRSHATNNVHVVYLKNAPAKETADSLTGALTNLRIAGALDAAQQIQVTADEGTNALIIAASAQDFEVISEIIEKLDIVREQVLVEMLIMEVSEDSLKEIGIDWATLDQAVAGSVRFFGATNFGPRVDYLNGDLEGLSIGAWTKNNSTTTIGPILHALEKESGVNILSTPHILTSNHHKARIVVGENRPFVTDSRITESDPSTPTVIKTFEYRDVGITLEITPHVSQGGRVRLEVNTEFTKLIETVTTPSLDTPTTAKRQAETVVTLNSGSTVVIGGLIRDDTVTVDKRIPLLSDIPLLGGLFRFQKDKVQKTNLLIFITPHVMTSQQDMQKMTDEKTRQMQPALEQFKRRNEQR